MDTLDGTEWDVVIAGTGFPQSLLALSLSRSGKRILHIDQNGYYGGDEAALSLSEAEEWAQKHGGTADGGSTYSEASVTTPEYADPKSSKLGSSRAYSLALAPQLVYSRSNMLPVLVSSRTHNQLDFQAVGSWFVVEQALTQSSSTPKVIRVPSGREDIFKDNTLELRAKRSLMKFLRFVSSYDEETEQQRWDEVKGLSIAKSLKENFGVLEAAIPPLLALALPDKGAADTTMEAAVPRIARHLRSIGMFGPGFSAVLPKWGGLAEVAQVACRACAVGGGVYVLGKGLISAEQVGEGKTKMHLSDGEKITTTFVAGVWADLPASLRPAAHSEEPTVYRSTSIASSSLTSLFPPTSEGGVTPAGAVVLADVGGVGSMPVNILVHSSEAGECPSNQCVLYASTASQDGFAALDAAVGGLLKGINEQPEPRVLWKMQFMQHNYAYSTDNGVADDHVIIVEPLSTDVVLEEEVLGSVKSAWERITSESEGEFMKFEAREGVGGDDEDI